VTVWGEAESTCFLESPLWWIEHETLNWCRCFTL